MGSDLRAVIYVESGEREPVYLQSELTAETMPDVTLYCDELRVHQSAHGWASPAERHQVDLTVHRSEDEFTVTVCFGDDTGVIVVFAPTERTDWPLLVLYCLDILPSMPREQNSRV